MWHREQYFCYVEKYYFTYTLHLSVHREQNSNDIGYNVILHRCKSKKLYMISCFYIENKKKITYAAISFDIHVTFKQTYVFRFFDIEIKYKTIIDNNVIVHRCHRQKL